MITTIAFHYGVYGTLFRMTKQLHAQEEIQVIKINFNSPSLFFDK